MACKALSASAWVFSVAAIGLGATHAVIADGFSSVAAISCLVIAGLGLVIGTAAHHAPLPFTVITVLTAGTLFAARIFEDKGSTPHSLTAESLFLVSQLFLVLGLVFIIRQRLTG